MKRKKDGAVGGVGGVLEVRVEGWGREGGGGGRVGVGVEGGGRKEGGCKEKVRFTH